MRDAIATILVLALLGGGAATRAQAADAPARIAADTTWTAAASPYRVVEDVRVEEGVVLTLEPGVTVELEADRSLFVAGQLVARGTEAAPIRFTGADDGDGPARWRSVVFEDSAVDAVFEGLDRPTGGSVLERCEFEYGARAVSLQAASPYFHACTFRHNRMVCGLDTAGGAALYVGEGSAPRVRDCTFEDNEGAGLCYGGAVFVAHGSPILQGNTFRRNLSAYGGAVSTLFMASPVVGNVFEDNESLSEGGAISLVSSVSALLANTFTGNHAFMDGGGVHVCVTCFPHANVFLHDNVVTGNTCEKEGAAGVGAAFLRGFSHNDLHGNLRGRGDVWVPSDFGWFNEEIDHYPASVVNPDVSHNWWGTTDPERIAETIFDGADEAGLGEVSYLPPLDGPAGDPQTRVTLTTRKLRYTGVGEPMPLFLTVYNPGAARDVDLALVLDYGEGQRACFRGPLGFPDEVREGDFVRLALPEGGVFFAELAAGPYPGKAALPGGTWHAVLLDAETGALVADVCSIGFELADAPGIEPEGEGE